MATVVNDLTIEPKAPPPAEGAGGGAQPGGSKAGPEMEREVEKLRRREHERKWRLWAH